MHSTVDCYSLFLRCSSTRHGEGVEIYGCRSLRNSNQLLVVRPDDTSSWGSPLGVQNPYVIMKLASTHGRIAGWAVAVKPAYQYFTAGLSVYHTACCAHQLRIRQRTINKQQTGSQYFMMPDNNRRVLAKSTWLLLPPRTSPGTFDAQVMVLRLHIAMSAIVWAQFACKSRLLWFRAYWSYTD